MSNIFTKIGYLYQNQFILPKSKLAIRLSNKNRLKQFSEFYPYLICKNLNHFSLLTKDLIELAYLYKKSSIIKLRLFPYTSQGDLIDLSSLQINFKLSCQKPFICFDPKYPFSIKKSSRYNANKFLKTGRVEILNFIPQIDYAEELYEHQVEKFNISKYRFPPLHLSKLNKDELIVAVAYESERICAYDIWIRENNILNGHLSLGNQRSKSNKAFYATKLLLNSFCKSNGLLQAIGTYSSRMLKSQEFCSIYFSSKQGLYKFKEQWGNCTSGLISIESNDFT